MEYIALDRLDMTSFLRLRMPDLADQVLRRKAR